MEENEEINQNIQTEELAEQPEKHKLISRKNLGQFIKFGIVGFSNTGVSLAVSYLMMFIFRRGFDIDTTWSLNVSTTCGYVLGVLNSYFWNSRFVFKESQEKNGKKVLAKSFICYGATYLLSMLLMDLLVELMGVPRMIAPIPRLIITVPLNHIANKLWAYKDR